MSRVLVGLPVHYRENTIEGVLNHEIGTHFLRKYNEKHQKWHKDRKKYNLSPYLKTEEGFASLNQLTSYVMQDTYIFTFILVFLLFFIELHFFIIVAAWLRSFPSPKCMKSYQNINLILNFDGGSV